MALSLYALSPAGAIPGGDQMYTGAPRSSYPPVVYFSVIVGPVLLTWGAFAYRDRSLSPLTPRRALLAPLLSVLGITAGVARFAYEWSRTTPFEVHEGDEVTTVDPSLLEIVQFEVTGVQFVALAAVSAAFVGAVAARRNPRAVVASALLPIAFAALAVLWESGIPTAPELLLLPALAIVPFAVGYVATRPE